MTEAEEIVDIYFTKGHHYLYIKLLLFVISIISR